MNFFTEFERINAKMQYRGEMTAKLDQDEVDRFDSIAGEWWDAKGKFRPLHIINPTRISYIREQLVAHFQLDATGGRVLTGLEVADIGCGGGLTCEPLARLGATVTGVDPSPASIAAARRHAAQSGLDIEYVNGTTDDLISGGRRFDCVLALEVIEHVPDLEQFLEGCRTLMKPGGILVLSTLNRTAKSFALGIVAAEYLLRWLPQGTHDWSRFITPDELREALFDAQLTPADQRGMVFNPMAGQWSLSDDCGVNYFMTARGGSV